MHTIIPEWLTPYLHMSSIIFFFLNFFSLFLFVRLIGFIKWELIRNDLFVISTSLLNRKYGFRLRIAIIIAFQTVKLYFL